MRFRLFCLILLVIGIFGLNSQADPGPVTVGETLPDIRLLLPEEADLRAYLGVGADGGEGKFNISAIKGRIVIIEIFSMYCPHCQREAPQINTLYEQLKKNPATGDIKLIGIGVGNSEYEVNFFKKKYDVRFPMFPDPDYVIHQQVKEARTPFFIGVEVNSETPLKVVFSHLGGIESPEKFLEKIIGISKGTP